MDSCPLSLKRRVTDPITGLIKGTWLPEEDELLQKHVAQHGARNWGHLMMLGVLKRSAKSCRLRYLNHLKPDVLYGGSLSKRLTDEEKRAVIHLQRGLGNKWSQIAAFLPGRTDNDVKNFWNLQRSRKQREQKKGTEISAFLKTSSFGDMQKLLDGNKSPLKGSHSVDVQETQSSAGSDVQETLRGERQQPLVLPSRKDMYPLHLTRIQIQELNHQLQANGSKECNYGGASKCKERAEVTFVVDSSSGTRFGSASVAARQLYAGNPSWNQWTPHGVISREYKTVGRAFLESLIKRH